MQNNSQLVIKTYILMNDLTNNDDTTQGCKGLSLDSINST